MKRKWTLFTFSSGDHKAVENYLNRQAERGWELESTGILARWRRTERTDLTYCVDLAKPRQDRGERLEYVEFCSQGGWELAGLIGQMYIFASLPGSSAIPIQTDPELEKKNYNKYYIRNSILSVFILILQLGFWVGLPAMLGRGLAQGARELAGAWMERWFAAGLVALWPVWALWGVWKLADFIRAVVMGRTGEIGASPRWVMWVNCVLNLLGGAAFVVVVLLALLDGVLTVGTGNRSVFLVVLGLAWGGTFLYRAIEIDPELFKGERRRHVAAGAVAVLLAVLVIALGQLSPYGQWDTNPFGGDADAMEQYALLENVPVVRGEDVGMPLDEEEEYFYLTHEVNPVGEHWELGLYYRGMGLTKMGCDTWLCGFSWQAELVEERLLEDIAWWAEETNRLEASSYAVLAAPPQVEMEEVGLEWADSAWYGENERASVLVVRVGNQVSRLCWPMRLMEEGVLEAVEGRLGIRN